jgi:cation diffusion facilitator CzcD-associated flavoprotein CzcO
VTFNFNTQAKLWTITATNPITEKKLAIPVNLFSCSGYYNYTKGYTPNFKDESLFKAHIHPQQWPKIWLLPIKKVVVIGSGATAVTIVPELAVDAEHVTMLQRLQLILPPCLIMIKWRQN